MLRRPGLPAADPRTLPIGRYAGQAPLPMTPRVALTDQLMDSLTGDPGIRLSNSTNRGGRYWGTDAVPATKYPSGGPKRVNRPEQIEMAPITAMRPKGLR